jgi:hypothetical protein
VAYRLQGVKDALRAIKAKGDARAAYRKQEQKAKNGEKTARF